MKSYDYFAVVYDGEVYCTECCPVDTESEEVFPIFADSEWDEFPVCAECNTEHDYVTILINDGVFDRFDIAEAYYVYLCEFHEGQYSEKYQRLCKLLRKFKPAPNLNYGRLTENGKNIYKQLRFVRCY